MYQGQDQEGGGEEGEDIPSSDSMKPGLYYGQK